MATRKDEPSRRPDEHRRATAIPVTPTSATPHMAGGGEPLPSTPRAGPGERVPATDAIDWGAPGPETYATDRGEPGPAVVDLSLDTVGPAEQPGATIELREEELIADKRLVQTGLIRIRRRVVTETRHVEVTLAREELTVERLPVPADAAAQAALAQTGPALSEWLRALQLGETLRLPIVEEELVIDKRPVVNHELRIDKRMVDEIQKLSGVVHREDARVSLRLDAEPARQDDRPRLGGTPGGVEPDLPALAPTGAPPVGSDPSATGGTLELREERLHVRKQLVEAGAVEVRTGVVSEQQSVVVHVAREETRLEQVPVERRPAERPVGSGEEVFEIPEYGEQVGLGTRPVVTEEISVGTRPVEEVQQVTTTRRREEPRLEVHGDVRLDLAGPPPPARET